MSSDAVRVHAVVSGRVQMVGFRAFVERNAHRLGLRGMVRNRHDGTVECDVEGRAEAVEEMLSLLRRGPAHARVEGVVVDRRQPTGDLPAMTVSR